jgi:hypothetical protein
VNTTTFSRLAPALGCLLLFTAAAKDCNNTTAADDPDRIFSQESSIEPMEPTVPGTSLLSLASPSFARTLPIGQRIVFQHQISGIEHGMLVIMRQRPDVAQGRVVNLVDDCVAGAASMAGHVFDGTLGLGTESSDLYACTGNAKAPFSQDIKVRTCASGGTCNSPFTTKVNYWWFVLGYDAQMRLTHSSPAFRFELKD